MQNKSILLVKRPNGCPASTDFEIVTNEVPAPSGNQVLVRNIYMSVDPYMRGRMREAKSYADSFELNEVLAGGAVGQVEESGSSKFTKGDIVLSHLGWREWFVADPEALTKIDPDGLPLQSYLGIMGMPGKTAYAGLLDVGKAKKGEAVFVSGGAGAVGSAVCQIAKNIGCRVVASAGSEEKVEWLLREGGVDAAINYKKTTNLGRAVRKNCPDGIDVYFDNVGGEHLQAALSCMNPYGRIAACGMISLYNDMRPAPGPNNLPSIIGNRLTIRGFIVSDHADLFEQCAKDYKKWIKEGRLKWRETILEGIERAPQAFTGLFEGKNFGKMIVKIGLDPSKDE